MISGRQWWSVRWRQGRSFRGRSWAPAADRGAALVMALVVTGLVSAVGGAVVLLATLDLRLAAAEGGRERASAAAVAAVEVGMAGLAAEPDWDAVLSGTTSLAGGARVAMLTVGGAALDLRQLTIAQQSAADRHARGSADDPRWRPYGWGRFDTLVPLQPPAPDLILVVWVADDGEDGDGDPARDTNGRMVVQGDAFGPGGVRAAWSAVVKREPHGVALVSWRLPRDWEPDP